MIKQQIDPSIPPLLLSGGLFLLGFIVSTYYARIKGFLSLPFKTYAGICCNGGDVVLILFFFLLSNTFLGTAIYMLLSKLSLSSILMMTLAPALSFFINIIFLVSFALLQKKPYLFNLIKDQRFPGTQSVKEDIFSGIKALILSLFALYTVICMLEAITIWLGGNTTSEQTAVRFLMQVKETPLSLLLALFTIVIAAPLIEEYLFRGVFQSFLRKHLGSIKAIILTSAIFSLFHFSPSQGVQNIAILLSLFVLSLYLGFVFEKTRSLLSSITLHLIFNLASALKIIFYGIN